jgi:hypothetical protein
MDQRSVSSNRKGKNWYSALGASSLVAVGVLALGHPSYGDPAAISESDVFLFGTTMQVEGASSQLVRTDAGVTATLQTHSLEPGVYSFWFAVFNVPENCAAPSVGRCGLGDLMNDLAVPSLLWGVGHVVGPEDVGNSAAFDEPVGIVFASHLRVSNPHGQVLFGPGLLDPWGADIHVVARIHGPQIPGRIREQMTTFDGGCDVNTCANVQFAVHED